MSRKNRRAIRGSTRLALFAWIKKKLTDGTIWEEYSLDDLTHYTSAEWGITYKKARESVQAVQFILDLEQEILTRKENGTLCDCVPLLSPYQSPVKSLCFLSEVYRVVPKATPYTSLGLASIAAVRLRWDEAGHGIPTAISYYMSRPNHGRIQSTLHVNMRYKCRICMEKYHPVHSVAMTRLLYDMGAYISKQYNRNILIDGKPFVKIDK